MSDKPSDSPLDEPEKPTAKVLCIGSFSPSWDFERRTRTAQQQLAHDLANAFRSNEAAGKYDPCPPVCVDPYCPNKADEGEGK